jgi:TonB family protein
MRSNRWVLLAAAVLVQVSPAALAAEPDEDLAVVHAEAPEVPAIALKARVTGTVTVRVMIDPAGEVTSAVVAGGLPLGLSQHAEAAARKWTFARSDRSETRVATLSFMFAEAVYSEAPDHLETSFDDPLTVRLRYSYSTVVRLPRVNGEIPEQRCPIHDQVMAVELVPIRYHRGCGLRAIVIEESAEERQRRELREAYADAREKLFPAANRWYDGGFPSWEDQAEVQFCQLCRDIESLWLARHPGFEP